MFHTCCLDEQPAAEGAGGGGGAGPGQVQLHSADAHGTLTHQR